MLPVFWSHSGKICKTNKTTNQKKKSKKTQKKRISILDVKLLTFSFITPHEYIKQNLSIQFKFPRLTNSTKNKYS